MSRVVAVIQARRGSKRLPDKVLAPLAGTPVIEHVVTAAKAASRLDDVVLATTSTARDDALAEIGGRLGVRVFRGSEDDVLGRFVGALDGDPAQVIVRLTGDNPLLDPAVIDSVVQHFLEADTDYASNMIHRSWPRGLDTEVLSRAVLERADREGRDPEHREHVTLYVRTHPELFRLENVTASPEETWPELRLSIDTPEDRALLERVFDALHRPGEILPIREVIAWLRHNPEVAALNAQVAQKLVFGKTF